MIPKVLHRIWLDEPVPPQYEAWWERFRALHPDWELVTWDKRADIDWLQNQALFDSFPEARASYALRADVLRYEVLNRYGGVYVDTDVEPLKALDPLLEAETPFIGWCSDAELDPAVIGSPAGHPAIQFLVDELDHVYQWAKRGHGMSPPGTTGPRFVTSRWRDRDDVRRLPPVFFFPYHWSRMQDGNGPWPSRSYAVHHWAAGWKKQSRFHASKPVDTTQPPKVSILIPFRDYDGTRTEAFEWVKARWQAVLPDAEIVVGTDEGSPFSKTTAVNDAYTRATGDVFVVTDADSWAEREVIDQGIRAAVKTGHLVVPWQTAARPNAEDSANIIAQDPAGVILLPPDMRKHGNPEPDPATAGVMYVMTRAAFEKVHGMDPRFRGWGMEDVSFRRVCDTLLGRTTYGRGMVVSLEHTRERSDRNARTWGSEDTGNMNSALSARYTRAQRKPKVMQAICNEHPLPGVPVEPIPVKEPLATVSMGQQPTRVRVRVR